MFHAGAEFAERISDRLEGCRTCCSKVALTVSGGDGTPTWPATTIQQPAYVSMRSASRNVGDIGLG